MFSQQDGFAQEQKEEGIFPQLTPPQIDALRSRFLAEVQTAGNISNQKEHWIRQYTDLENQINKTSIFAQKMESEMATVSDHRNRVAKQQHINQAYNLIAHDRQLQHYSTISYSLLLKLEQLETALKNGSLQKREYLETSCAIDRQMLDVDQLRQLEYVSSDMQEALHAIAGELLAIGRCRAPLNIWTGIIR
jgi:hypothetical protein